MLHVEKQPIEAGLPSPFDVTMLNPLSSHTASAPVSFHQTTSAWASRLKSGAAVQTAALTV